MAYNKIQFEDLIQRVLTKMEKYVPKTNTQSAVNLLLGTAAVESDFGTYLQQIKPGPGLGPFQMEPNTEADIWMNYILFRKPLKECLFCLCGATSPQPEKLETDLLYAIAMARIHYLRRKENLPAADNIPAMGGYWKVHYNTVLGKGTVERFIRKYNAFVVVA
ncbi:MAG: hypothetical protein KKF30_07490 [Proteobacteria bacterium]|nr:hypothetical protein [Pseudomonadota bacterium]MBU4470289.1 hypothetical protein [Pseudomonadota bacterium]MCG2752702.1 hypothetical protein [Desulfobacteraceae bacterium]